MSLPPVPPVSQALPFTVTVPMVVPASRRVVPWAPPLFRNYTAPPRAAAPLMAGSPRCAPFFRRGRSSRDGRPLEELASSSKPWWALEVRAWTNLNRPWALLARDLGRDSGKQQPLRLSCPILGEEPSLFWATWLARCVQKKRRRRRPMCRYAGDPPPSSRSRRGCRGGREGGSPWSIGGLVGLRERTGK